MSETDSNVGDDFVAVVAALDQLNQKLVSNSCRLKTVVAVEAAATEVVEAVGASRCVGSHPEEYAEVSLRQETRGRPGANTRYRQISRRTPTGHVWTC
jgi:hypothetical protein